MKCCWSGPESRPEPGEPEAVAEEMRTVKGNKLHIFIDLGVSLVIVAIAVSLEVNWDGWVSGNENK